MDKREDDLSESVHDDEHMLILQGLLAAPELEVTFASSSIAT